MSVVNGSRKNIFVRNGWRYDSLVYLGHGIMYDSAHAIYVIPST